MSKYTSVLTLISHSFCPPTSAPLSSSSRLRQWIVGCKDIIHLMHRTPCSGWSSRARWLCAYLRSQYVRPALCSSWINFFPGWLQERSQGSGLSSTPGHKRKSYISTTILSPLLSNFLSSFFYFFLFFFVSSHSESNSVKPQTWNVVVEWFWCDAIFSFTLKVTMRDHARLDNTLSLWTITAASYCWETPVITIICSDL